MSSTRPLWILLIGSALFFTACNRPSQSETQAPKQAPHLPPIDPATVATISGVVNFEGTPPAPQHIDMSADPSCNGNNTVTSAVVTKGHLANVVVYVKDGLNGRKFDPLQDVVIIGQKNCAYEPHVAAVMAGQPVEFLDDDATMHNIHPMPKHNKEWNQAQQANGGTIKRSFENPELMMPIKCNQHPWMKMYLSVFDNPFFAVTGKDGSFTLKGLPPGTYTIAAVHEKYGEQDRTITVGPKDDKQGVTFDFQP